MALSLGQEDIDYGRFAQMLFAAADSASFTELDFEGPGGPSPLFLQKLLAHSVALAVVVLDYRNAWQPGQRDRVLAWGSHLAEIRDPKRQFATLDTLASIAAARMAWGALAQNPPLFEKGIQDFHRTGRGIDPETRLFELEKRLRGGGKILQFYPDKGPSLALRINNEMIQHMVRAAEIAAMNGIDAYNFQYNGLTLLDVIQEFSAQTLEHGGSHVRRSGFVAHLGWVPIFLHRHPVGTASENLKKLVSYYGTDLKGISVTEYPSCFWGYAG